MQCRVDALFLLRLAALLENLNDDELVASRETEVRVLTNEFIILMLGYNLTVLI